MKRTRIILTCALLLALLLPAAYAAARSPSGFDLSWNVLAGGGRQAGAGYVLESAAGQPVAAANAASNYSLCAGYLCAAAEIRLYLPLVRR